MQEYQKETGTVPAFRDHDWVCSTGLFQLSMVWFRLGDIDRGNRAFEYACRLQNESGGWFGSYLLEDNMAENNSYFPISEISWAVKFFLDALYYKNVAEFEKSKDSFLSHIDKSDGRYQIIRQQLSSLKKDEGNKVLDLGCGKGRYLKNLAEDMPDAHYMAVDLSEGVMSFFDGNIAVRKQGSLTDIPYGDDVFDMVYACESLEHAIDIENALQEMARVTRPGGKIVVIDKDLKALGSLESGPWEQWFDKDSLKRIMEDYCTKVEVYPDISYEGKKTDGLFCAWVGKVK
jgi:Methylase involved in ubiquinone/menaquinone biosynthesis